MPYRVNEGEGAFYGPKIDFHLRDCLGRRWQCGTIQLDFAMPEKFDLTYIGEDGARHRPVMLHRTVLGSIERFLGILIEHFAGALPLWLAPVQVVVLPVAERHLVYAHEVRDRLAEQDIRVECNEEPATLGAKIRKAELEKIPYLLIVGDREDGGKDRECAEAKRGRSGLFCHGNLPGKSAKGNCGESDTLRWSFRGYTSFSGTPMYVKRKSGRGISRRESIPI
jgi:threonyl-tRNA synthetase (EC 6.1.1.3)/Ser-tRNA(Thr) hydrolase (EC 3.1.1.-)